MLPVSSVMFETVAPPFAPNNVVKYNLLISVFPLFVIVCITTTRNDGQRQLDLR